MLIWEQEELGMSRLTLFYNDTTNRFEDEYGRVYHDIYRFITPNQFLLFRTDKFHHMTIPNYRKWLVIELCYMGK
jgi:3-methyladenine DNA glycosylase/8-oxoguanine DNA glycosylase